MNKLEDKVKGKTVAILAAGKSLEILEQRIQEFKDLDIVWICFNSFDIIEDNILAKINKTFDITFNLSQNFSSVEDKIIVPRLVKQLERNGIVILSSGFVGSLCKHGTLYIIQDRLKEVLYAKDMEALNRKEYRKFSSTVIDIIFSIVPYSPKKIVLFGLDGALHNKIGEDTMKTYYRYEEIQSRRPIGDWDRAPTTTVANKKFKDVYNVVLENFQPSGEEAPQIFNCSPGTTYTCFDNITYNEAIQLCKSK